MPPKILLLKKTTSQSPKRTSSSKEPVNVLKQALMSVDLGEGRRLSPEQVRTLTGLTFTNGELILRQDQPQVIIDVINMLQKLPFEDVVMYLRGSQNPKDLVMNSPLLENERGRVHLEVDNIQSVIEAEEGVYQCENPECRSQRTISFQKQVRSADEPMTTFVRCLGCGKRWRID